MEQKINVTETDLADYLRIRGNHDYSILMIDFNVSPEETLKIDNFLYDVTNGSKVPLSFASEDNPYQPLDYVAFCDEKYFGIALKTRDKDLARDVRDNLFNKIFDEVTNISNSMSSIVHYQNGKSIEDLIQEAKDELIQP